jgi:phosphatidylserine/phosphatidylglycerophosphate/cardiolipin synthase-like enzyme
MSLLLCDKMGFMTKSGWIFLIAVLVLSVGIVDYVKHDSFLGLYSFGSGEIDFDSALGVLTPNENLDVFFCPEDECANKLIEQINSAEETIDVAVYSFTHTEISDALLSAKERGVIVRVVFDYLQSENNYSEDETLFDGGIEVLRKKGSGAMHNKFTVIDGKKVLTGSFNYSQNADTRNDENLILILDEALAQEYLNEFNEILEQARAQ